MMKEVNGMRWYARKYIFAASRFRFYQKFIFLCFIIFSNLVWAKNPIHLFIGISGGYGTSTDAFESTGTNGLIRFALGTLWPIHPAVVIGSQLGFQTGSQIRLSSQITEVLGQGNVPAVLNTKNPIDFLLVGRYILQSPLFFQVKGGAAFISGTVTGADILATNIWIPEIQVGLGFNVNKHSRVTFSYQKFYGSPISISVIDLAQGTYRLQGTPSWEGGLLTFEHDL